MTIKTYMEIQTQQFDSHNFDFTGGFTEEQKKEIIASQPELVESAMVSILARAMFYNDDIRYAKQDMTGIRVNGDNWEEEIRLFKVRKELKNEKLR